MILNISTLGFRATFSNKARSISWPVKSKAWATLRCECPPSIPDQTPFRLTLLKTDTDINQLSDPASPSSTTSLTTSSLHRPSPEGKGIRHMIQGRIILGQHRSYPPLGQICCRIHVTSWLPGSPSKADALRANDNPAIPLPITSTSLRIYHYRKCS